MTTIQSLLDAIPPLWKSLPQDPVRLTQFFANVGVCLGGFTATVAFILVGRRTLSNQWDNDFRRVFSEFWKDDNIAVARQIIEYDEYYEKFSQAFRDIAATPRVQRNYSKEEMDAVESIDRLCAKIGEASFFGAMPLYGNQKRLFNKMFIDVWARQVKSRPELSAYVYRFWPRFPKPKG